MKKLWPAFLPLIVAISGVLILNSCRPNRFYQVEINYYNGMTDTVNINYRSDLSLSNGSLCDNAGSVKATNVLSFSLLKKLK